MAQDIIDCGEIQLKVDVPDDPADVSCDTGDEDCFRFGVPVFFKYTGSQNPAPTDVYFCDLEITGQVISSDPGVEIDYSLSNSSGCREDFDFDQTQSNNNFRYTLDLGSVDFGTTTESP